MTHKNTHIEVAVPLPVFKTYTYAVPEPMQPIIAPGKRVLVPFGNRKVTGYALGTADASNIKHIKPIIDILDTLPIFPASMIPLFKWISDYYMHPLGEVIKEALPGGININECVMLHITESGAETLSDSCAPALENDILCLIASDSCRLADIPKKLSRILRAPLNNKM
jgi:primosomal protein N' (replication factor Y)